MKLELTTDVGVLGRTITFITPGNVNLDRNSAYPHVGGLRDMKFSTRQSASYSAPGVPTWTGDIRKYIDCRYR